ncbi:hypothetical protein MVEG_03309 [Podila verticillata NRRL 6337]|nr:hypothetical protein MVEG_03309 [Podila verticillata NRRL 6337]
MIAAKDLPFPDFPIPSNPNPPIPSITVRPVKSTPSTSLASAPDDCSTCVSNSMMSVPACKELADFEPDMVTSGSLTLQEAACYCSLTYDFSWLQSCSGSCPDSFISSTEQNYTSARRAVPCAAALERNSSGSLVAVSQWAIWSMILTTLFAAALL